MKTIEIIFNKVEFSVDLELIVEHEGETEFYFTNVVNVKHKGADWTEILQNHSEEIDDLVKEKLKELAEDL